MITDEFKEWEVKNINALRAEVKQRNGTIVSMYRAVDGFIRVRVQVGKRRELYKVNEWKADKI